MSDLVNRLRGIYNIPVNDGAGLLDGKDTFTRTFDNIPPIMGEAANRIEALERAIHAALAVGQVVGGSKTALSDVLRGSGSE